MIIRAAASACLSVCLAVMALAANDSSKQSSASKLQSLPPSLDKLYPPQNAAPALLHAMLALARPLSGIAADVFEDDFENARLDFAEFKRQYIETSKLVPEWQGEYPLPPLEELEGAIETREPGKIMAAMDGIGNICRDCHISTMAPVQQRFHWGDFAAISITDPLTNQEVEFRRLKLMMESNLTGIGLDLEQGQKENAQKQLQGFEARFQALITTCGACHDSDRKYYVGEDVLGMLEDLRINLSQPTIDRNVLAELLEGIGRESCFKCHLVHIPAAYSSNRSEIK